jgi:hypothetical protein
MIEINFFTSLGDKNKRLTRIKGANILITTLITVLSCSAQNVDEQNKRLILEFENQVLKCDTLDFEQLYEFTNVHKSLKGTVNFENTVRYFVETYKLTECFLENANYFDENEYRIYTFSELQNGSDYEKGLVSLSKIRYSRKDELYFFVPKTRDCAKIYTVKKGKIISFFSYINVGKKHIVPFVFNRKLKGKELNLWRI